MQHVQIPFIDIRGQIEIERLALADEGRAVCGKIDDPALIDFERGAEYGLLTIAENIQMLDRPFMLDNGLPDFRRVGAFVAQQFGEMRIAHHERAGKRLVIVDVGRNGLDTGAGAAAYDTDGGGRRDGDLVTEPRLHADLQRVGTWPAFLSKAHGSRVGLAAD